MIAFHTKLSSTLHIIHTSDIHTFFHGVLCQFRDLPNLSLSFLWKRAPNIIICVLKEKDSHSVLKWTGFSFWLNYFWLRYSVQSPGHLYCTWDAKVAQILQILTSQLKSRSKRHLFGLVTLTFHRANAWPNRLPSGRLKHRSPCPLLLLQI